MARRGLEAINNHEPEVLIQCRALANMNEPTNMKVNVLIKKYTFGRPFVNLDSALIGKWVQMGEN